MLIEIAPDDEPDSDRLKKARSNMKLVAIGVGLGLAVSLATRIIASQLFGITATDPLTFVAVPLLLLIVTFLACYIPARRATKVDPMVELRFE